MSKSKTITLETGDGVEFTFEVKRDDFIKFVNSAMKNTFNAQQNLLASAIVPEHRDALTTLLENPANVPELCGALLEEYKPSVTVSVKKPKKSPTESPLTA